MLHPRPQKRVRLTADRPHAHRIARIVDAPRAFAPKITLKTISSELLPRFSTPCQKAFSLGIRRRFTSLEMNVYE